MNFNEKTQVNIVRCAVLGIIVMVLGSTYTVNAQLIPSIVKPIVSAIAAPTPATSNTSGSNSGSSTSGGTSNTPAAPAASTVTPTTTTTTAPTPAATNRQTVSNRIAAITTPVVTRTSNSVYKTINTLLQQERSQRGNDNNTRRSSNNTQPENARPLRPRDDEVKKPEAPVKVDDSKPVIKSNQEIAPKKSLMYQTLQTVIPADPYIENGFSPITSNVLYGISGLVALAGVLLVLGRPVFIARRLASLFTFA